MKKILLLLSSLSLFLTVSAQTYTKFNYSPKFIGNEIVTGNLAVGQTGAPDASAIAEFGGITKGFLIPRMTAAQKDAINSPATGLMIYQTDGITGCYYYSGSAWAAIGGSVTGTPTRIPYFDSNGNLTSDSGMWRDSINGETGISSLKGDTMVSLQIIPAYGVVALTAEDTVAEKSSVIAADVGGIILKNESPVADTQIDMGDYSMAFSATSSFANQERNRIILDTTQITFVNGEKFGFQNNYSFPTDTGSVGQVLAVDSNDALGYTRLSWQTPAASSGWSLTGNAGTDPNVNFIGTTDSVSLLIYNSTADGYYGGDASIGIFGESHSGIKGVEITGFSDSIGQGVYLDGASAMGGKGTHIRGISGMYASGGLEDSVGCYIEAISEFGIGMIIKGASIASLADIKIVPDSGRLQITNIGEGAGKVLTSDATGMATWQTPTITGAAIEIPYFSPTGNLISDNGFLRDSATKATFIYQDGGGLLPSHEVQVDNTNDGLQLSTVGVSGTVSSKINIQDSSIVFTGQLSMMDFYSYSFPNDTGSVGQVLAVDSNDGAGNTTLGWQTPTITGAAIEIPYFSPTGNLISDVNFTRDSSTTFTQISSVGIISSGSIVMDTTLVQLSSVNLASIYTLLLDSLGISFSDSAGGSIYIFPKDTGSTGQVLGVAANDGTGVATLGWQSINNTAWGLTGNAGTNPTTNFIGTTDNEDLKIKRNNIEYFNLDSDNVNLFRRIKIYNADSAVMIYEGDLTGTAKGISIWQDDNSFQLFSNTGGITTAYTQVTDFGLLLSGSIQIADGTQGTGKVLTSDATGMATWQNAYADNISLTGQTATISATNVANTGTAGLYEINFYMVVTTADAGAGDVTISFFWNDGTAARTITSNALPLTSTGYINHITGVFSGNMIVNDGSGSIQYATTVNTIGTADYALYVNVIKLN